MRINEKAPVIASGEIEVAADAITIWEMMATIDRWPEWNADVLSAALQGELAPGSKFIWKAGGLTITSTILQVERPRILAWTGNTMGIKKSIDSGLLHLKVEAERRIFFPDRPANSPSP